MTQTFTQDVFIDGSTDDVQLRVQGYTTQTEPLQTWEDSVGTTLARINSEGRVQVGDLGLSTPEAQIETSSDITLPSTKPKRGLHALGRISGAITDAVVWAVHELEVIGSGGISAIQTALRAKITNGNTGSLTSAEIRGGDFQAVNQAGTDGDRLERMVAFRATASNAVDSYANKLIAVEALVANDADDDINTNITEAVAFDVAAPEVLTTATIDTLYGLRIPNLTHGNANYAIKTGQGLVDFGDTVTAAGLKLPTGAGAGKILSSDASGNASWETIPTPNAPLSLVGTTDSVQFLVKSNGTQTNDLQQWQDNTGTVLAAVDSTGKLIASELQLPAGAGAGKILSSDASGNASWETIPTADAPLSLVGTTDSVQFLVKGNGTQTNDLQQWQDNTGTVLAAVDSTGKLIASELQLPTGAGAGKILSSDASGNASWQTIPTADAPLSLIGTSNAIQLFVKGDSAQSVDLFQIQDGAGNPVHVVGASGYTYILGQDDNIQLLVKGHSTQTFDLQQWQDNTGTVLAAVDSTGKLITSELQLPTGAGAGKILSSDASGNASWQTIPTADAPLSLIGTSNAIQLFVKGDSAQSVDLFQIQDGAGNPVHVVGASGYTYILGQDDNIQLLVKGHSTQTFDLQQWQDNTGTVLAAMDSAGKLIASELQLPTGAGSGKILSSDASGNASWQTASSGTVTSVGLSAPTGMSVTGSPVTSSGTLTLSWANQNANRVLAGPTSGGAAAPTFRALVAADVTSALTTPPAIGGTTPAAGTFTTLDAQSTLSGAVSDAATNTVVNAAQFTHNSSGTPAASFGVGLLLRAKSSTTADQSQAQLRSTWVDATHASRKARVTLAAFDTAARDGFAVEADGSAARVGFFGVTPVVKQTGGAATAAGTYTANEQGMINRMYTAMRNYGLLT